MNQCVECREYKGYSQFIQIVNPYHRRLVKTCILCRTENNLNKKLRTYRSNLYENSMKYNIISVTFRKYIQSNKESLQITKQGRNIMNNIEKLKK